MREVLVLLRIVEDMLECLSLCCFDLFVCFRLGIRLTLVYLPVE